MTLPLGEALAWLDRHQDMERMLATGRQATPDLSRMRRLVDALGHPERACPVLHITGTNGKTSTARAATQLLVGRGLSVGTFTSPHLQRIHERISTNGEPIGDDDLAQVLSDLAGIEGLVADGPDDRPTWFELLAAAAFAHFADRPVDVAVVEVGMGGRWDATNVADAAVAVVTNVGLDHVEWLGPTRADIAAEKAGIARAGATLVLGERDPDLLPVFEAEAPARLWLAGRDWAVERNTLAVGGRSVDLRTPGARYDGLWLDLHGRHQADNFAAAVVAVEAFFDAPTAADQVRQAAASARSPGRMEVLGRQPLVLLDGAKNVEGAETAAATVAEEFADRRSMVMVVGMLGGKDPEAMLAALGADRARLVLTCPPPSPRAQDPAVLAEAARRLGVPSEAAGSVEEAVDRAVSAAGPDDVVLVTGSLYVVGAARTHLGGA